MSQNILLLNAQDYFKERFIEECSKKNVLVTEYEGGQEKINEKNK